jgi:hypothetical protein
MVIVLLTVIAHAQGMGRSQKGELKKEHQAKKKEDQEKRRRLRTHTPFIACLHSWLSATVGDNCCGSR